jgi:hypothetical protein
LPPDFEEHIASIKWSMCPFANRICSKLTTPEQPNSPHHPKTYKIEP